MKFTVKTRLPGLNEYINACRHNKYKGNELKQNTDSLIGWHIRAAKLKKIDKPVKIKFIWHEKSYRRDPDNIASAKKYILDALQKQGILQNDNLKWIKGFQDEFEVGDKDYIEIIFEEV
jgi:Holliday junction resolvase RusA-like endonuclease